MFVICLISIAQYFEFNFISIQGILNVLLKIFIGGYIINYLGAKFAITLFKVLYHLCIISLLFFLLINILKLQLPAISIGGEQKSYLIYGTSFDLHIHKNAGMFWEPGAHAGILTLCLGLNFNNLKMLWLNHKSKILILIITLLTTQSTTGYLVGFVIAFFYFLQAKNFFITFFAVPIILIIGLFVYQSTDFMKEKIESQFEKSTEQEIGDFSNSRFGSIIFDWHYIEKHPFIGNGLHESTRYADHQYLFVGAKVDVIGSGNGFSHYLASMGVFFILGYFYLLWQTTTNEGIFFSIVFLVIILLNLQGEQWFNFPLYLGLPFLIFKNVNFKKRIFKPFHHQN